MKKYIALFSITFIFLLFFSGYSLYMSIYAPLEMYEVHYFTGDHFPAKTEILFSGFRSPIINVYSLITALIHNFFIKKFVYENMLKRNAPDLLLRSVIITLFLAGLYFIYLLFQGNFRLEYFISEWQENRRILLLLFGQYLTITIIFLLCTNSKNKRIQKALHNP